MEQSKSWQTWPLSLAVCLVLSKGTLANVCGGGWEDWDWVSACAMWLGFWELWDYCNVRKPRIIFLELKSNERMNHDVSVNNQHQLPDVWVHALGASFPLLSCQMPTATWMIPGKPSRLLTLRIMIINNLWF